MNARSGGFAAALFRFLREVLLYSAPFTLYYAIVGGVAVT